MSHILVKWVSSSLWDVYNVRAIADTNIGLRLLSDINAIEKLRGSVVAVNWKEGEPTADAELLDFGLEKSMECRRTKLVRMAQSATGSAEDVEEVPEVPLEKTSRQELSSVLVSFFLFPKLELSVLALPHNESNNLRMRPGSYESGQQMPKTSLVNIGGGVLVETTLLERLHSHCQGPTKFARHLLRSIFTVEEMRGKSLFGKGSNANKNAIVKEALDPVRVNAVIGYTCSKFATTTLHLKNSLSSMLARELKWRACIIPTHRK
ncbi:hypothetical protein HPB49_004296 [Dermacentor silvarum]|uniref:Uncharacterized protein n=1 Tax=Dermacentor silvarum TaxID=543639 RepID=A0ACB8DUM0_DERSI|nr:hypothetical protein HPB49_004296 [Dermacentor silvarum]